MAHHIQVILAKSERLHGFVATFEHAVMLDLEQGFAMIPLVDELFDSLPQAENQILPGANRFLFLNPTLCHQLGQLSLQGPIAYCETEYFGGWGEQGAVVWDKGQLALAPCHSSDVPDDPSATRSAPINQALRRLGVLPSGGRDEFDTLGLGRFRSNKDWIEQPTFGR